MPAIGFDRNLLFGILALQMDFIARDALVAAMHAWVLDKTKPLGQILFDQQQLSAARLQLLDALVDEHLRQHNNDPQQSLAAVSSIRSVRHDLQAIADADVQASLAHFAAAHPENDSYATDAHVGPGTLPPHARFHVLRPHAKGGLGEVFVAQDVELKREVALKEIQERYADHPESRARFLLEAEVTGHLEHPGIVPVYGLGAYADGRPFYAMRFIKGDSLKDAIAAFHAAQKKGRPESERSLALRQLLGRFVDVCQAIAYAHSRGVLHRDLKPGNVMLGKYGETLVVDWGLAKMLGSSDVEATESALVSSGDSGLTQAGRALGTPAFMSPEQAAGKLDELGPASDTYSLGATLYCLLTGQPPFTERDVGAVLGKVQKGDFLPPRQVEPRVPAALEAVCLKAMALRPADRYESPRVLAGEIEHWLADEPVAALREPLPARVARAARKRPALTAGIAALLVTGVIALGVSTLLIGQAQRTTDVQRLKAEDALTKRDEAETKRALAQIDALLDAAPGAVPNILKNLEENLYKVLPDLRRRYAHEKDAAKKARLALALVTDDATVRDAALVFALNVDDPAEAVMVRDALKPHGEGLAAGLWAKVDGNEGRFRALVALAAIDADNPRWKKEASVLVEELLGSNPLRLGAWVAALQPVSAALYEPLGKVFRDALPERAAKREAAAEALALYLKATPDAQTLFELLLDADGRQHALLSPLLAAHREKAIVRMKAEMAKTVDRWKDGPLDAKWATVNDATKGEVEKASGIVAERWALCQLLPMERLEAVTQTMGKAGYRPLSVRPWVLSQPDAPARVAVVWTRDGREWRLGQALTPDALKEADAAQQKAGLIPADVAAYATKDGVRHVGLWRRGEADEKAVLYAGVSQALHKATTDEFAADGFVPARVQAVGASYCGVWVKGKDKVEGENLVRLGENEGLHKGRVADGDGLLMDVSLTPAAPPVPLRALWLVDLRKADADAAAKPGDLNPVFRRGVALYNLGRDKEALEAFDTFLAKGKGVLSYRYRALVHARSGNAEQARKDLGAFAKASTSRPLVASATALVGLYLGDADATKALDEAVEADKKDATLVYEAACCYARASEHARMRQVAWAAALLGSPSPLTLSLQPKAKQDAEYADRAVEFLRLAVARGYADLEVMQTHADLEAIRTHAGYAKILADAGLTRQYASVWRNEAKAQAEGVQGLSAEAHLAKCRDLAAQGYRPVSVSLASLAGEKSSMAASAWHRPVVLADKDALARRQANAAATLLVLKQPEQAWPLLRHSPDPTVRSWLVWRVGEFGSDAKQIIERLWEEKDTSARRALILALGEYTDAQLPSEVRGSVVEKLLTWYREDADPGIHAAISWLLRHSHEGPAKRPLDWGQAKELEAIDKELAGKPARKSQPDAQARGSAAGWYVNGQGQTLVMIKGPVEFRMGSPLWEADRTAVNERPHVRRIERNYVIASTSVTLEQWGRFLKERPDVKHSYVKRYSPEAAGPAIGVTWYEAAEYCNWLSEKEGIPKELWCYPEKIGSGMQMHADYLRRTGYRLPSEAELEYACRAGSEESRYYGSAESLLGRYAIYRDNAVKERTWPVGQKRPNEFGLFDAHGNVWNWCNEVARVYRPRISGKSATDVGDVAIVDAPTSRALRGGSFYVGAPLVRSSFRYIEKPVIRFIYNGLRVCRTLPPSFFTTLPPPEVDGSGEK